MAWIEWNCDHFGGSVMEPKNRQSIRELLDDR